MVHQTLKPSLRCTKAAAKANQVLGQLARGVTYRDRDTLLRLYNVYVRPHLEYAVASWCPYTKGDKEVLEKVQRRALAMVSNLKGKSYKEQLAEVKMITLESRRDNHVSQHNWGGWCKSFSYKGVKEMSGEISSVSLPEHI